ncbi:MAG: flagellar hook-basal body complex protein FliE [Desulfobacterales bacterium]
MVDLNIGKIAGAPVSPEKIARPKGGSGFGDMITNAIHRVNGLEKEANSSIIGFLQGKTDLHESIFALGEADKSMRILLAVRNKVLDAYREVMRMQF